MPQVPCCIHQQPPVLLWDVAGSRAPTKAIFTCISVSNETWMTTCGRFPCLHGWSQTTAFLAKPGGGGRENQQSGTGWVQIWG